MTPVVSLPYRLQRVTAVDAAEQQQRSPAPLINYFMWHRRLWFPSLCISEVRAELYLPNHNAVMYCHNVMQIKKNTIAILVSETHLSCSIFHKLPVRHKSITVHLTHVGSVPGKVRIRTWKEEKKRTVSLDNNGTLYCSLAHNGFLCSLWYCCSILLWGTIQFLWHSYRSVWE